MDQPGQARIGEGQALSAEQICELLPHFGIQAGIHPEAAQRRELAGVELAYGLIGAAERNAINAEEQARSAGLGNEDFGEAARSRYLAAGVQSEVEEFALAEWRATRFAQAVGHLAEDKTTPEPQRDADEVVRAVELTAAALAALLSAATAARNPHRNHGEAAAAAHGVRQAMRAMDEATTAAHECALFADLLSVADKG